MSFEGLLVVPIKTSAKKNYANSTKSANSTMLSGCLEGGDGVPGGCEGVSSEGLLEIPMKTSAKKNYAYSTKSANSTMLSG